MTSVLVFAGSARRGAFSKQLAAAATTILAEAGAKPTLVDLADFEAPLYNGDLRTHWASRNRSWISAASSRPITG